MRKIYSSVVAVAAGVLFSVVPAAAATFSVDGLQYSTLTENTVTVNKYQSGTDIVIPSTVKDEAGNEYTVVAIANTAFYGADIQTVVVPGTVKEVGRSAFYNSRVSKATLEEGVESLGYAAFAKCWSLMEVELPSTLTELGAVWTLIGSGGSAFYECSLLKSINVPAGVKTIPPMTFSCCYSLTQATLHEGLETIDERAFENCQDLKEIDLPSTVTTLERGVFQGSGLNDIVFPGSIKILPNSCYIWCHNMENFLIEEGVVEVGKQSFADCGPYTSVTVPNSVEWIRSDAFQGNGQVTEIHLGSGLRRVGHCAFAVWVPDMMTNTPQYELTDIYIASPVPPIHEQNDDHIYELEDDFFFGGKEFTAEMRTKFYSEVTLHVPVGCVDAYRAAVVWGEFVNIVEMDVEGVESVESEVACALSVVDGVAAAAGETIEAYNAAGVKVAAGKDTLDLRALPAGVYVVRAGADSVKVAL